MFALENTGRAERRLQVCQSGTAEVKRFILRPHTLLIYGDQDVRGIQLRVALLPSYRQFWACMLQAVRPETNTSTLSTSLRKKDRLGAYNFISLQATVVHLSPHVPGQKRKQKKEKKSSSRFSLAQMKTPTLRGRLSNANVARSALPDKVTIRVFEGSHDALQLSDRCVARLHIGGKDMQAEGGRGGT